MTMLNIVELQTGFPHAQPAQTAHLALRCAPTGLTAHEHLGFELGWDYAHYRVTPPAPYSQEPSPLRNGLLAGQAAFGLRTLAATRHVRKWLQLRDEVLAYCEPCPQSGGRGAVVVLVAGAPR